MKGFKMPEGRNHSSEKIEVILDQGEDKVVEAGKVEDEKEETTRPLVKRVRPTSQGKTSTENTLEKTSEMTLKTEDPARVNQTPQSTSVTLKTPRKKKISPNLPQVEKQEVLEESQTEEKELPPFLTPKRKPKPIRMTTYVEENVYNILQELKNVDISITAVVNAALREYLTKYNLYKENR